MAPIFSANLLHFLTAITSISIPVTFTATVIEDLNNLQPPPDFNFTITKNCQTNPSLRYCNHNAIPFDNIHEIFKFTIVASHLCNISNNPNCIETFPKIDLHSQPRIAPLYLSFTFFWKYCPLTILSIDLSNNSIKGNFPTEVFYCSQIQALDLSHNSISGDVPVQKFSFLENLTLLNLSYNHFSEFRISDAGFFNRFNSSSFFHSGLVPNQEGFFKIKAVFLLIGFPFLVIAVVVVLGWLCFSGFSQSGHEFTPSVLNAATDRFSVRNLAGKNTYRGILRDGSEVRIYICSGKFSRETRERFVGKSRVLVQLRHKNIVPVLGWCDSRRFRANVSEWVDGENIEAWVINSVPAWDQRVKVILGIAAGICYLHEEWPQVNYSLKTRNIVLSEDGEPLITRFKIDDHHHHSSTKKTYKFGMFVLEMVTNRRPKEEFGNEAGFVEWVKMQFPENPESVIDKRMKKNLEIVSEAADVVEFGLMCTDLSSDRQPGWDKICDLLSNVSCAAKSAHRGHKHVHHRGF
ncbi:receptor-like serine/threonine-protein kinase ale2 [Phtheirospermum japonicum]|uniref:Receptor-like serine/threonine-protein kinase ale2 n=1 Tax=Phtheirospermum japonicum TaxID=374723 RepID=A0A830CHX9_9LAMI|nr:receptor-like serine/threonine-protein kinase ale2 [Phtheirospermum japonicum]